MRAGLNLCHWVNLALIGKFKVFEPVRAGNSSKAIGDTRWVLTWKMVACKRDVRARLAAEGYQDPELMTGLAETSWCAGLYFSHLQATPSGCGEKMEVTGPGH